MKNVKPIPLEESDPELAEILQDVCEYNVSAPKKDQITANFDTGKAQFMTARAMNEVGRNDPCPCGSGKKYKKCCYDITRN